MEIIRTVVERLQTEIMIVREMAADLNATHVVTDVMLTRMETHAVKLETYADLLTQSLG
jgi:hypothetical protein